MVATQMNLFIYFKLTYYLIYKSYTDKFWNIFLKYV